MNNISIIIPTRNEEGSLPSLIKLIDFIMAKNKIAYEIIVVDDHSTDRTQSIVRRLSVDYPLILHEKKGRAGKSFSIMEGCAYAQFDHIAMIDSDLQYPPEAIPEMLAMLKTVDVVVANRKEKEISPLRKFMSNTFKTVFGKALFGLSYDIQSGLKVFKREVLETVKFKPSTAWTFDLEFLYKAREAGYKIGSFDINFAERTAGKSKINFLKSSFEIAVQALFLRGKKISPQHIRSKRYYNMQGSGIGFKKKRYITHTTLHHSNTAIETFLRKQKIFIAAIFAIVIAGLLYEPLTTLKVVVAALSFIYFIDVFFNLFIILKSLHKPQEISVPQEELDALVDSDLPIYSILCPLYKEAHVIPQFIESISKIDWPKNKLDVMLLLEEDDVESIEAASQMNLPSYVRTVVVPHSFPKTKPKACNYGLSIAKGEYLVIYDAEDIPDPKQLKKAYQAFQTVGDDILCLQAKLNYYNPNYNLLTRFFTAEYSLWFDVTLTGLQSINTSLPLGGTSNHFRVRDLLKLQGWDPFNVTEDADLGIRLFKMGYKTAIIDSTTLEEANSRWGNWIRQRSRWIKGYMQTYLVHNRDFIGFVKRNKLHALYFQLTIGGKIAFILINPLLWLATIAYFTLYAYVGSAIESFYPSIVFYMAVVSLVFGNFLFLFYYMIGIAKRDQEGLMKYVLLIPIYWMLISVAGFIALYELIFKPHYWQKTTHGFHLLPKKKNPPKIEPPKPMPKNDEVFPVYREPIKTVKTFGFLNRIALLKPYMGGAFFMGAILLGNVLNFVFNAYLGRVLDLKDFGLVSLIGSINSFSVILFVPFALTMTYQGGFLIGRFGNASAHAFWEYAAKRAIFISMILTIAWIAAVPFLASYFRLDNLLPFYLFAPVWLIGLNTFINKGYISAKLQFGLMAAVTLFEPIIKLLSAVVFVSADQRENAYIAVPLSILAIFIYTTLVSRKREKNGKQAVHKSARHFPGKYLAASIISGLSTLSFLSLDVVLAKHFLTPTEAGQYALISLIGKMLYFLATLSTQLLVPLISRREGEKKDSKGIFYAILAATAGLSLAAYIPLGLLRDVIVPVLFGEKTRGILPFLPLFLIAMICFSISGVIVSYYQIKKIYAFSVAAFLLSIVQFVLINHIHDGVHGMVTAMTIVGVLNLLVMTVMHFALFIVKKIEVNVGDIFGLFAPLQISFTQKGNNILIFNWRDTKHKWAGGAESYVHEMAKQWVKNGNSVTVFCGNDYDSLHDEVIDGVHIMRRGGFYTMYIWAAIYYVLKLRGKFDMIVDSENGIPFFTPLFSRKPIFLLIHHVHQEVFREHLVFPFAQLASWIEGTFMPYVYKNKTVITVSESSKKEIQKLGFAKTSDIQVVNPGIDLSKFSKAKKTAYPSIVYVGRLKPYKNVDVVIKAFAKIITSYPDAQFVIAGEGESHKKLEKLTSKLNLTNSIQFLGKVSDSKKAALLSSAWLSVQPSMIEGWGITVIEANASGTPVVASRVNGLQDSILDRKTGILVQAKSIDGFSSAIQTLIKSAGKRKNMSKQSYSWSKNFSWEKSAKNFMTIMVSELEALKARRFVTGGALLQNN